MDHSQSSCAAQSVGPANILLTTFLSTITTLHCNISRSVNWPEDYGEIALNNDLYDYDFVVVGSGSAGSLVAGRLAENPNHKVLLVEAGGDPPIESEIPALWGSTLFTKVDWKYPTQATSPCLLSQGGLCIWNLGKVLGGSHSINGLIHLRGSPHDYNEWGQAGNRGWHWEDVLQYFKKTENFLPNDIYDEHGEDGPITIDSFKLIKKERNLIMEATHELGYREVPDFTTENNLGFGKYFGTMKDGRRISTAKAFLTVKKPNLHVIKHAVANKIIFDNDLKAVGLSIVYKKKHPMTINVQKEIIVSAGTVETPKLLMLSGIGPEAQLKSLNIPVIADLPVGNNLQDHIRVNLFFKYKQTKDSKIEFLDSFYNDLIHNDGNSGNSLLDIVGFINTHGDQHCPNIEYLFGLAFNISLPGFLGSIQHNFFKTVKPDDQIVPALVILLKPKSQGSISLRSTNYKHKPVISPNYYDHPDDAKVAVQGIYKLLELEKTEAFKKVQGSFLRLSIPECIKNGHDCDEYWMCYLKYMSSSMAHPIGTAKMGPDSDETAVVDDQLRVLGVKGLRVIDASIMPTTVSANPNAAVMMIAEKGVDMIRSEWG